MITNYFTKRVGKLIKNAYLPIMQIKKTSICAAIVASAAIILTPMATRAQSYGLPMAGQHKTYLQRLDARLNRMGANLATLMTNDDKVQDGVLVCLMLNNSGATPTEVKSQVFTHTQYSPDPALPELGQKYASAVVLEAVKAYCPEQLTVLEGNNFR